MKNTTKKKAGILLLVAALLATGMQMDVTTNKEKDRIAAATDASMFNNSDTLIISNTTELKSFAEDVCAGNDYKGKTVKLANDIVFDSSTENNFTPIGKKYVSGAGYSGGFAGSFDGCGYSIRGAVVNDSQPGLFGHVDGGTIQNVTIASSEFDGSSRYGGGIVAYVENGSIYNCKVLGCKIDGGDSAGGIAGISDNSSIANCMVSGIISSSYSGNKDNDKYGTGGIVGYVEDTTRILNCCNYADLNARYYGGGIVGYIPANTQSENTIQNCHNVGKVIGDDINSGGIVASGGYNANVSNCYTLEDSDTKLGVTAMGNKIMTAEEMQSQAFLDNLNELAKSNGWVEWEMQSGYSYPVLKDIVVATLDTTVEASSSPEISSEPTPTPYQLKVTPTATAKSTPTALATITPIEQSHATDTMAPIEQSTATATTTPIEQSPAPASTASATPAPSGLDASVAKITMYAGGNKNTTTIRVGTSIRNVVSDNNNVVEVLSTGELRAKKKGFANIYASVIDSNTGAEKRCLLAMVTVKNASLKIKNISEKIKPGTSLLLKVKKQGVQGAVKWKSSRPAVATINRKGLLKTKKQGVAVISVSCGGKVKKYKIRVAK